MMKTTTKKYVTKLIVAKTTKIEGYPGDTIVLKAGRVLETIKHAHHHYYPWAHTVTFGHGIAVTVPVENLKVKWFVETKTVTVKNKEIKVR